MTIKIKKIYPYILLFLSTVLLLYKCFYSFCWSDETFYFATTYRFFQGDSIFLHEWFPTQLSSVVLLPLFSIYMLITGSTTGIILYFRILFVIYSLVNATVMYRILKQHTTELCALICSLMLMFYTHLNIATLSYYTLSVQLFLMSMLLVYHYYKSLNKKHLIIAGTIFAVSVLSLPTLVIAYFLVMLIIGIVLLINRKLADDSPVKKCIEAAKLPAVVIYTFIGIVIPAVIFFIFMFCNVSILDFIKGIPYVLSDEEHGTSFIYPMKKFFIGINEVYGYSAYASYLLIFVSFFSLFVNKLNKHILSILIMLADVALFACNAVSSVGHTGYIQTALCLFAIPLFFQLDKKDWKLFFTFIVSGAVFSLVYSYSSNGYLYILSMGHFICSIGCVVVIERYAKEQLYMSKRDTCIKSKTRNKFLTKYTGPAVLIICMTILCITLVQTMSLRLVNIYRDAPMQMLTEEITKGPAKGLHTTKDHLTLYNNVYDTITNYCQSSNLKTAEIASEGNPMNTPSIFITKLLPFGYMCTDLRCAAPTTWRTQFDSVRLEPYYEMNPDRYPDMILVLDEQYGTYETCGDVEYDPNPNANEINGYLLEYVNDNNYTITEVPCGLLYTKEY